MVQDLDSDLCDMKCCGGACEGGAEYTCGGELGRVSVFNGTVAPVTVGLNVYLTNEQKKNVVMDYQSASAPPTVIPPTTTTTTIAPTTTTANTTEGQQQQQQTTTTTTTEGSANAAAAATSPDPLYKSVTGARVPTTETKKLAIFEVKLWWSCN